MLVTYNELITDVCCNACGSISTWETNLNLNNFTDWNPVLSGQITVTGIVAAMFQKDLSTRPVNNSEIQGQDNLENDLITILEGATIEKQDLPETIIPVTGYKVNGNEEIRDVLLNATGTIVNWEEVLNNNSFEDWNPDLTTDELIFI